MSQEVAKKLDTEEKREPAVGYTYTPDLTDLLRTLDISLLVSTYQAQRIMTFAPNGDRLFMLMRVFERPTGIALNGKSMALVTRRQVWFFEDAGVIHNQDGEVLPYDLCFTPRRSHVTGDIAGHEAAWFGSELIVVNTRFSCLCKLTPEWSFVPIWKPPFITEIAPDDRCHLNGLVIDATGPKFITALGQTNTKEGWRPGRADGGIILDVPSSEVVSAGISMPHSPRLYAGKLWVLESGLGELQTVEISSGKRTTVRRFPGYLRGLAFYKNYAFVGLCKIRTAADRETFGGLPIEAMHAELQCGIAVVDISSGKNLGFIEFTKGIEELFDIHILPGVKNPHVIGFEEETINGLYVLQS